MEDPNDAASGKGGKHVLRQKLHEAQEQLAKARDQAAAQKQLMLAMHMAAAQERQIWQTELRHVEATESRLRSQLADEATKRRAAEAKAVVVSEPASDHGSELEASLEASAVALEASAAAAAQAQAAQAAAEEQAAEAQAEAIALRARLLDMESQRKDVARVAVALHNATGEMTDSTARCGVGGDESAAKVEQGSASFSLLLTIT